jgi:hypothetical protein
MTKVEHQIDMLDKSTMPTNTSYTDITKVLQQLVLIDTSKFVSPTLYFEAVLKAQSGYTIYAQLYDATSGSAVSGSELSTSNTTTTRLRSGSLTLTSGHEFKVQTYVTGGSSSYIYALRIIVIDDISAGWSAAEEQVEIGDGSENTSNTSYTDLTYQPIFLYEASPRDGTITVYFEACLYAASSDTAYAEFYDKTAGSAVVAVSTSNTSVTRVRSAAITLTDGDEYVVKIKCTAGGGAYITGAKLIIQQSGTITKTQLSKKVALSIYSLSTSYVRCYNQTLLDESQLPSSLTFYYQTTLKISNASYTAYSELYDIDDSVVVSGSEQITSSTSWVRLRSGSLTMTDQKQYDAQLKTSSASGTAYITASWLIINVVVSGGVTQNITETATETAGLGVVSLTQTGSESPGSGTVNVTQVATASLSISNISVPINEVATESCSPAVVNVTQGAPEPTVIISNISVPISEVSTEVLSPAAVNLTQTGLQTTFISNIGVPITETSSEAISVSIGAVTVNITETATEALQTGTVNITETSVQSYQITNVMVPLTEISTESGASATFSVLESSSQSLYVYIPGVVKTKIFLIIGDLAIQLTG